MALTSYPLQDKYETSLSQALTSVGTTMFTNSVGNFTFPSSVTTYAIINPGKSNMEVIELSAKDTGTISFTIDNRNTSQGNGVTTTAQSHAVGSKVIISDNYQFWKDIVDEVNLKPGLSDNNTWTGTNAFNEAVTCDDTLQFTGTDKAGLKLKSLTTAQRVALSAANGEMVYDTDDDLVYQYISGGWASVDTGTAYSGANGIGIAGTAISVDATDTTTFVKTSSGAGDENKVPVLNASGQLASGFLDSSSFLSASDVNIKIGTDTWNPTAGTDTKVITHNLGRTPRLITIYFGSSTSNTNIFEISQGVGQYDGTSHAMRYWTGGSTAGAHIVLSTHIIAITSDATGTYAWNATVSVNGANSFTLDVDTFLNVYSAAFSWKVE